MTPLCSALENHLISVYMYRVLVLARKITQLSPSLTPTLGSWLTEIHFLAISSLSLLLKIVWAVKLVRGASARSIKNVVTSASWTFHIHGNNEGHLKWPSFGSAATNHSQ